MLYINEYISTILRNKYNIGEIYAHRNTQTLLTFGNIIGLSIKLVLQLVKIVTRSHYIRIQYTLHTRFLSLLADYDV